MTYFLGNNQSELLNGAPRYLYALRRTDEGDLFVVRLDQLAGESIAINNEGDPSENYEKFSVGVDFYNGRAVNHELVYDNLKYEQYRWDDRLLSYYIDDDGNLSVIIGQDRDYPTDV